MIRSAVAPNPSLFSDSETHDPGGRVRLGVEPDLQADAVFGGPQDCYRYRLTRRWGEGRAVLVVMMNPSTADVRVNDPTVAKVTRMARVWGGGAFGRRFVGNVFAYRATDQGRLNQVADPVGPENDRHLLAMAQEAALVVFAYGAPKGVRLRARGPAVVRMLAAAGIQPHALRLSTTGHPWHPLYLPDATPTAMERAMMDHPVELRTLGCPVCRRAFGDTNARYNHMRAKHPGKITDDLRPARRQPDLEDESLAEVAIEATIKRAAGEGLTALEDSLLP